MNKPIIITHSTVPTKEVLISVYDVINKLYQGKDVFYTSEEVKELKSNPKNTFL